VTRKKILIVEDEKDIHEVIEYNLGKEGYEVISAYSGDIGLKKAISENPDIILLDIMLPEINGLDVCRELRSNDKTANIPIVMISAKNEDVDIITGLELGADDYVTKPFSPRVLIARIRTILRRGETSEEYESRIINIDDLKIDEGRHEVLFNKRQISLTLTEFQILLILAKRRGWVFSRAQLIDELREGHHVITDRAIDVQITNLRKKLGEFGKYIETVRGVGYRMRENYEKA
jgi:two-component system phosphate regulon response regulator PhoB